MPAPSLYVLTANRLSTGEVLYWKTNGWVEALADAEIFTSDADAQTALIKAQSFVGANLVVSPYLFEARQTGRGLRPVKEREIIRSLGPSVRPDTGKQADHV